MKYTEEQEKIINSPAFAICCNAVPGSGKTTTLVGRIKRMVETGTNQKEIVVITYTIAAADQLKTKLANANIVCGFVGTLHSFAFRHVQEFAYKIGFTSRLTLVENGMRDTLLAEHLERVGYKGTRKEIDSELRRLVISLKIETRPQGAELAAASWYRQMLDTGALDYDGIIYWAIRWLRTERRPSVYHLFWDEGQDMSEADWMIFMMLPCKSRFIVGDRNQAIYRFRGGDPKWMDRISDLPEFHTYSLSSTRRFGPELAMTATGLIRNNPGMSWPTISAEGSTYISTSEEKTIDDECERIASVATRSGSCAVLVRTNFLVDTYSAKLSNLGVMISKVEKPTFPVSWEPIKLALAAIANPDNDSLVAMYVQLVTGQSATDTKRKAAIARQSVNQFTKALPAFSTPISALEILDNAFPDCTSVDAVGMIIDRMSGDGAFTVSELLVTISQIERESEKRGQGVVVSTYHSSKGLEWDNVAMPCFVDYPSFAKMTPEDFQEERRLIYVAITRARSSLFITWPKVGLLNQFSNEIKPLTPSRFIKELTGELNGLKQTQLT